jgi:hypothetical protein
MVIRAVRREWPMRRMVKTLSVEAHPHACTNTCRHAAPRLANRQHDAAAQATPSPDLESNLPPSASSLFSCYTNAASTLTSSLQRSSSDLANDYQCEACLTAAKQLSDRTAVRHTHFTAYSAEFASAWKRAAPTQPLTTLLDKQYRTAACLNLGLPPLSSDQQLPADCPLCNEGENAVAEDPWHYLSCTSHSRREVNTRHNAVKDALYRAVLVTGGQAYGR